MSILQRDYVLRMIQQLAQAMARILGLKQAGKLEEALQEVGATADSVFGSSRQSFDAIDEQSAARLLGSGEKIEAYALLTAEEAAIRDLLGETTRARSGQRRALSLYLEALILEDKVSDDARAAIAELRRKVDDRRMPRRYQDVLASQEV